MSGKITSSISGLYKKMSVKELLLLKTMVGFNEAVQMQVKRLSSGCHCGATECQDNAEEEGSQKEISRATESAYDIVGDSNS